MDGNGAAGGGRPTGRPLAARALDLLRRPGGLWLEDGGTDGAGRASCEPAAWLRGTGDRLEILAGPAGDRGWLPRLVAADPGRGGSFDRLAAIARAVAVPTAGDPPSFFGGLAGCFSYDLGRRFERIPDLLPDGLPWDFVLGLYDEVVEFGADGCARLHGLPGSAGRLAGPWDGGGEPATGQEGALRAPLPEMSRQQHGDRVHRIRDLIRGGTIYQANLTLRFSAPAPHPGAPLSTFLRLRRRNPAPFAMFADLPGLAIVSASPEGFLDLDSRGSARSRPIKGTAARGGGPENDARQRLALLSSEKDRSELSMIVDLVRNDLGRVCLPGSVDRQPSLVAEAHPSVWHLVGDVRGTLAPGRDAFDLLRAAFPPGSCIGAPKIRAMADLETLELSRRGPYTGALGWIGLDGTMRLSVAIRTIVFRDGVASYGTGGGIVWDSDADAEWEEAQLKGRALAEALVAGSGEEAAGSRSSEVPSASGLQSPASSPAEDPVRGPERTLPRP